MTVELKNVLYSRGRFSLKCDSISADRGTLVGVIGRNGSGKSTLLKVISGALKPETGTILLDGRDVRSYGVRELSRKLSFVQQEIYEPLAFSVKEVMAVSGYSRGTEGPTINEALGVCEIDHLAERSFSELSGGERRLVTLAAAIYQDADIVLLDEPTTFLDVDKELLIHRIMHDMRESGKTVIVVMHDIEAISDLADSVIIMNNGQVLFHGRTDAVMTPENLSKAFSVEFEIYDRPAGKGFMGRRTVNR